MNSFVKTKNNMWIISDIWSWIINMIEYLLQNTIIFFSSLQIACVYFSFLKHTYGHDILKTNDFDGLIYFNSKHKNKIVLISLLI